MNPTAALRPSPSKTLAAGGTAHQLAGASIAENTWRAYSRALRRLEEWLGGRPLSDPLLAAYLGHLFDAGVSPAVAGQVVASVRFRTHLAGIPSPAGEATTRVLAGFRRECCARGRGSVDGVRWEQADAPTALPADGSILPLYPFPLRRDRVLQRFSEACREAVALMKSSMRKSCLRTYSLMAGRWLRTSCCAVETRR